MKIGIIADIHGRYDALQEVLARLSYCGAIINLGDVADFSPRVNECYDLLKQKKIINCIGNHEQEVLTAGGENEIVLLDAEGNERSQDYGVSEENKRFVRTFKTGLLIDKDGLKCHFSHGHKVRNGSSFTFEYLSDCNAADHFATTKSQIAFCGHLHRSQMIIQQGTETPILSEIETPLRVKIQPGMKYGFNVGMLSGAPASHKNLNYAVLDMTNKIVELVLSAD